MSDHKRVRLFRYGRHQAVRIPVEFELPGREAIMHRDGDRLVIEPGRRAAVPATHPSKRAPCGHYRPLQPAPRNPIVPCRDGANA